jgi:hypothetical protein
MSGPRIQLRQNNRVYWAVPRVCEFCGDAFYARELSLKVGDGRFCSRRCGYLAARAVPLADRFWPNVTKTDTCWLWKNGTSGYGAINYQGRNHRANRVSWLLHHGPVPDGQWVLHRCDNPPCVNPSHLFLGDRSDNMRDAAAKGRLDQQRNPLRRRPAMAVFTPDDVRAIRAEYEAGGVTLRAIGARHGVTKGAIWRIVRGLNWRDVS